MMWLRPNGTLAFAALSVSQPSVSAPKTLQVDFHDCVSSHPDKDEPLVAQQAAGVTIAEVTWAIGGARGNWGRNGLVDVFVAAVPAVPSSISLSDVPRAVVAKATAALVFSPSPVTLFGLKATTPTSRVMTGSRSSDPAELHPGASL